MPRGVGCCLPLAHDACVAGRKGSAGRSSMSSWSGAPPRAAYPALRRAPLRDREGALNAPRGMKGHRGTRLDTPWTRLSLDRCA